MTIQTLERAKEIRYEVDDLKKSLSQVSRGKLFDIQTGQGCISSFADPFLAELESSLKHDAQQKILYRIQELEKEFVSL